MKKIFCFLFAAFVSAVSLFANPFSYIMSGSYAYYHDGRSFENDAAYFRGYLVYHMENNKTAIAINNVDVETKKNYPLVCTFVENDKKEPEIESVAGLDKVPENILNDIKQSIVDILNFEQMYRINEKKIEYDSTLEDKWDDFSLYYHFSKVFPVFKFDRISLNDPDDNWLYVAISYGVVHGDNFDEFLNDVPEVFEPEERPAKSEIPQAAEKKVMLNGYQVTVDENWHEAEVDDITACNLGVWLQVESIRDAQIMIEKVPPELKFKTLKDKEELLTLVLLGTKNLVPYSVKLKKQGNDLYLTYYNYDETKWITFNKLRVTKNVIINFSSFLDVYSKNKDYCNKIIDGIKIK